MEEFEIILYKTDNMKCPVEEYLNSIEDKKLLSKIVQDIGLLKVAGNTLKAPYSKKLQDDLFELRTIQSNNISRVIYFFVIGRRIVLTNGFIKKSQKTPKTEIERAIRYKNDFIRRFEKGEFK